MKAANGRRWDPHAVFEWFEFTGDPSDEEKAAALKAVARAINEQAVSSSPPAWSGLVASDGQAAPSAATDRWGLTTPTRLAPVPGWLRRGSPHQRLP